MKYVLKYNEIPRKRCCSCMPKTGSYGLPSYDVVRNYPLKGSVTHSKRSSSLDSSCGCVEYNSRYNRFSQRLRGNPAKVIRSCASIVSSLDFGLSPDLGDLSVISKHLTNKCC